MPSQDTVHFARGASYFIIQSIITDVALVVSFAVLARLITTAEMGVLAVLYLVIGFCQIVLAPALSQATTKFVAENMEKGNIDAACSAFYQSTLANMVVACALAVIIFLGADGLSTWLIGQNQPLLFEALAVDTVLSAGALPTLTGALLGLQKFREQATIGTLSMIVRQGFIILLVIELRSLVGLVIAWAIGDAFGIVAYLVFVVKALGSPRFDFSTRSLFHYAWPLSLSNLVGYVGAYFDRALLLIFVPLATLGVYNAALTAFGVLTGISSAVGSMLFSAYSSIHSVGETDGLARGIFRSSRYMTFAIVPLSLGLLATAKPALALFVGQAYVGGTLPLIILCGTLAITLFGTVLSPALLARGETRASGMINVISVISSLAAGYLLVPMSGMLGASLARALGIIVSTVLLVIVLRGRIRLRLDVEAIAKSLAAGGIMALVVFLVQVPDPSRILLPVYILAGVITYTLMLRILRAVREEDIRLIRRYFGARLEVAANLLEFVLLPKRG